MNERQPLGRWTVTHTIIALFLLCVTGPGGVFGLIVGRRRPVAIASAVVAVAGVIYATIVGGFGVLGVVAIAAIFAVPAFIGVGIRGVLDRRSSPGLRAS